ncbi:MAG: magnesium protoporphyrin IX methyltransferase [Pseudomonadota bacterium]
MQTSSYLSRRSELETYFDKTAAQAWERLTSDAPVSGIRATVRAGRDAMRETLAGWLAEDLSGRRILDAGCGTGQFAILAAARGADVVAIDLAESLVEVAQSRAAAERFSGTIEFVAGDMFDPSLGQFDHVVAMDSLIHYAPADMARLIAGFASRTNRSVLFTHAPRTPALTLMHVAGKLFPRSDRSPAICPVSETQLKRHLDLEPSLSRWGIGASRRIQSSFYHSQAVELVPT